jgi:hypothetical protein
VKTIAILAVAATLLLDMVGSTSSVGGPMTDLLISFAIMLAVGIYAGWGRGPVGWTINVVLAVIGGMAGLWLISLALESAMNVVHFEGKLATSHHPLRYIADVAMPFFTVLGSWLPTAIVKDVIARGAGSSRAI